MKVIERNPLHDLPREELFTGGHRGDPGHGAGIAVRQALKALGPDTVFVVPASYLATVSFADLDTSWRIPFVHSLFECSAAVAAGIRLALDLKGKQETTVVSWAGDAGTADIGFQAISGAAERDENIIHVCYDDELYWNTGGQAGALTPAQARSLVTPLGKPTPKKDMPAIMVAHGVRYVATASIAHPLDFIAKVRKAREMAGHFRYLHVLVPNPRAWGFAPDQTVTIARLAVECGLWPLYEVENGQRRPTVMPEHRLPVQDYIRAQARFATMADEDVAALQRRVDQA